ncbi:talin-2 [Copidosoma floridanum]|uniref:talin-2 n=1 Tax=Copidosoma floridanum TaxID=29053 RepID=UPI0006C945C9|nr:talin-2 [Copidosoma floridanum]
MATLSLRISIPDKNATKMMQFDPNIHVEDAFQIITDKLMETYKLEHSEDYGLFFVNEDLKKGLWLESGRRLNYYILKNEDVLEYRKKIRYLRVRMLDGTLKTVLVDESQPVANLMVLICTKIGITNHEEYSLVRETAEDQAENSKSKNFGTSTLRRLKIGSRVEREAKMDQMKKKLKTDDELNWINPSKTLREQDIDETETVLLRRKFFFSDQNIDSSDPVQLSLLYVQCQDAILSGKHPTTQAQACIFAGIQCQVLYGDHKEDKHKAGFLQLREFLPQSYCKAIGIEKKIFAEHKKHAGLTELDAKVLYTKTARSLSTYGVTFFLVKEKDKSKNKLVPRLLGVTKDSILRLDEKTKEILQTWPLTSVKKWGASPKTFSLDFGDYSNQYYSVQTTEAEQILRIISGYIDIILKKQKARDYLYTEPEERFAVIEDSVCPLSANTIQPGTNNAQYFLETMPFAIQNSMVTTDMSEPQKALLTSIVIAKETLQSSESALAHEEVIPDLGNDVRSLQWTEQTICTHKQNIVSQIASINAATAQVVTLMSNNVDNDAMSATIETIATKWPEVAKSARIVAALNEDEFCSKKLLNATQDLCFALTDLLTALEPHSTETRPNLLNAATYVGEVSYEVLLNTGTENVVDRETQDAILSYAKIVANTMAVLVLKAKNMANNCGDSATQNHVVAAATDCVLVTSQLVACTKVVSSTVDSQACQSELIKAASLVKGAVDNLEEVCDGTNANESIREDLSSAGTDVSRSLDNLLDRVASIPRERQSKAYTQQEAVEEVFVATDSLFSSYNDTTKLIKQARLVGLATEKLIQCIRGKAERQSDAEQKQKLLAAAKTLADATAIMAKAASQCTSNPEDLKVQRDLRRAVEKVREATATTTTPAIRRNLVLKLGKCAKVAAFFATRCVADSAEAGACNTSNVAQKELNAECSSMAQHIPDLISGVKGVSAEPDNSTVQLALINASEPFVHSASPAVEAIKRALPTITDGTLSLKLNNDSQQLEQALVDLRSAVCQAKEVCTDIQLDAAESLMENLKLELDELVNSTAASLKPMPRDSEEFVPWEPVVFRQRIRLAVAQLIAAAEKRDDYSTGIAAKEISVALKDFVSSVKGIVDTMDDQDDRQMVLMEANDFVFTSMKLVKEARLVLKSQGDSSGQDHLAAIAKQVSFSLDKCVSHLPGQKCPGNEPTVCDDAVRKIQSMIPLLENSCKPISDSSYSECLDTVMRKSNDLSDGMTGIVNSAKNSEHELFSESVEEVSHSICDLIEATAQASYLAGARDPNSVSAKPNTVDLEYILTAVDYIHSSCDALGAHEISHQDVLATATSIAKNTSILCNACRSASSKTNDPVAKRHLSQLAKDVANSTTVLVKEMKALEMNFCNVHRDRCVEATKPLLEAIDNLCAYAGSPEFMSQPDEVTIAPKTLQEPIINAGKAVIVNSSAMILTAKSLDVNPKDPSTWQVLANHSKSVSDSIKLLVASIRAGAPGQKECDLAITKLAQKIHHLDTASSNILSQTSVPHYKNMFQEFIDRMDNAACELHKRLELLRNAAKYKADNIGQAVMQIVSYCDSLVDDAISMTSHMIRSNQQAVLLGRTKNILESTLRTMFVTKECSGRREPTNIHGNLYNSIDSTKKSLKELQNTLESLSVSNGAVSGLIDSITRAMVKLESDTLTSQDNIESFVTYQTGMVETAKEIARTAQEISTKSNVDDARVKSLVIDISHTYTDLARETLGASIATSNKKVSTELRTSARELGKACSDMVQVAGTYKIKSDDTCVQKEIFECSKAISEKVSQILEILQAESHGTQTCINAASVISGVIGDLDTTIMFATAGSLHAENKNDSFANHRSNILEAAKALVKDTKQLVAGAASSQEQLSRAAENIVSTITQLAEAVKYGAASLGSNNPEAQIMLIHSVRDVSSALGDLVQATKSASGKPADDPKMAHLKESAEIMIANVTSLIKTVKAAEDEHTRGTRALESTIEAVSQEIKNLTSSEFAKGSQVTPEDVIRCTKDMSIATAKAVSAGNSCNQDDLISAANMGRKSIGNMLAICKVAGNNHGASEETKQGILRTGHDVATNYKQLLEIIHQISMNSSENKHMLLPISRKIAQGVTELASIAQVMKRNDPTGSEDPTVIAENELLEAAASIEAAAKKLASLRPRQDVPKCREDMNFDEMILEASKSIATATSALIRAASAAQRELVATGKVSATPLTSSDDGQWSEGLISAAKMVAAATHSLVESANDMVQGYSGEDRLVSSAKQVAGSTAQLLVACKVKADSDCESTKRLQAAGSAVKRATDSLVRASQQVVQREEQAPLVLNERIVGGIAQEIDARSEVLRIERELEEAREKLMRIRKAKYRNNADTDDTDDAP